MAFALTSRKLLWATALVSLGVAVRCPRGLHWKVTSLSLPANHPSSRALARLPSGVPHYLRWLPGRVRPSRPMARASYSSRHDPVAPSVPVDKFFSSLFGFVEDTTDLACVYRNLKVAPRPGGGTELHSQANGRTFNAGEFRIMTLGDLQRETRLPGGGGTLSLIVGQGSKTKGIRRIDVGAMQADPGNRGATFQVASNFNCLEFVSPHDSAANGVSKYIHDLTQGPAASISCAPALVHRNYFVPHDHGGRHYEGQLRRQINLLEDWPVDMINGYLGLTGSSLAKLGAVAADPDRFLRSAKVGVHRGVQVTSGLKGSTVELCSDPNQTITQVFTAAANLADVPPDVAADARVVAVAQLLLKVSYTLTLWAGAWNSQRAPPPRDPSQRPTLYLTLVGGGVFGNRLCWIHDALQSNADLIQASGLDVRLVVYNKNSIPSSDLADFERLAATILVVQCLPCHTPQPGNPVRQPRSRVSVLNLPGYSSTCPSICQLC